MEVVYLHTLVFALLVGLVPIAIKVCVMLLPVYCCMYVCTHKIITLKPSSYIGTFLHVSIINVVVKELLALHK